MQHCRLGCCWGRNQPRPTAMLILEEVAQEKQLFNTSCELLMLVPICRGGKKHQVIHGDSIVFYVDLLGLYKYHGIPDRAKIPAQKILLGNVGAAMVYFVSSHSSMLQHHSSLVHLS